MCMGSRCRLGTVFGCVGLGVAFGVSAVFAADWYAKDNLQPGHDPISSSSLADLTGSSSSSEIAGILSSSSGTDAIAPRAIRHDSQAPTRKAYRDLKGRAFDKQIPYRVMF